MPTIRMLKTLFLCEDGWNVKCLRYLQEYQVSHFTCRKLCHANQAIRVPSSGNSNEKEIMMPDKLSSYRRLTLPEEEPFSTDEVARFLRIDAPDEKEINRLVLAAREYAECYLRQALVTQVWGYEQAMEGKACYTLPVGPVQEIVRIMVDGQVLPADTYLLLAAAKQVRLLSPPTGGGGRIITIQFKAGYGHRDAVPAILKQGMLMHIAALYDQRGGEYPLPPHVMDIYDMFRERRL